VGYCTKTKKSQTNPIFAKDFITTMRCAQAMNYELSTKQWEKSDFAKPSVRQCQKKCAATKTSFWWAKG